MKILIVNGPNLNLLGTREPGIYGSSSFEQYLPQLRQRYPDVDIEYFQSNVEGELINKMQEVGFTYDGIVLNAGAYTHTSVALHDCIRSLKTPLSRCISPMSTSVRSSATTRSSPQPARVSSVDSDWTPIGWLLKRF